MEMTRADINQVKKVGIRANLLSAVIRGSTNTMSDKNFKMRTSFFLHTFKVEYYVD
jgi:hypothetical protein